MRVRLMEDLQAGEEKQQQEQDQVGDLINE